MYLCDKCNKRTFDIIIGCNLQFKAKYLYFCKDCWEKISGTTGIKTICTNLHQPRDYITSNINSNSYTVMFCPACLEKYIGPHWWNQINFEYTRRATTKSVI